MDSSILLYFFWPGCKLVGVIWVGRTEMPKQFFFQRKKKNVVNVHFNCNYVVLFECFPALSLVAPSGGKVLAGSGRWMEEKGQEKLYQDTQSSEKRGNATDEAGSSLCGESPRNQKIGRIWHCQGEGHPGMSKSPSSLTSASYNCIISTHNLGVSGRYISRDTSVSHCARLWH